MRLCLVALLCVLAVPAWAAGNIPEGLWRLDEARSKKLEPSSQTLWIIKDDGQKLAWVSVETFPDGRHRITSWTGTYDAAEPVAVAGTGFLARVTSKGPGNF